MYWDEVDTNDVLEVLRDWAPIRTTEAYTTIRVKKTRRKRKIPEQKTEGFAGFDFQAMEAQLPPGESTVMPTGLVFGIPEGNFGLIKPRSSMVKAGLTVDEGIIDSDYQGEICVVLVNRHRISLVRIYREDRIAQMIMPFLRAKVKVVRLDETRRGQMDSDQPEPMQSSEKSKVQDETKRTRKQTHVHDRRNTDSRTGPQPKKNGKEYWRQISNTSA